MSFIKRFCKFLRFKKSEEYTDKSEYGLFTNKIELLKKNSIYPISPYQAFKIAEENHNLKSDYFRNADKFISYLDFTDCKIDLVDGSNENKYWLIQVTEGKFSSISSSDDDDLTTTYIDGFLTKKDFKLLRCLIDVNTGEYIYYPKE